MEHPGAAELIPLYALDALDGDDLARLNSHLETCDECRDELDSVRSVAAVLTEDEPAPDHLWEGIAAGLGSTVTILPQRRPRRLAWAASVAAALAAVLGILSIYQAIRISDLTAGSAAVAAAAVASEIPGAVVTDLMTDEGTVAQVILTPDGEGFVLPVDLDPLGEDRTYQLWVITSAELAISAGVLGNDPGAARFSWVGDVAGFALTREVAGGVVSSEGDVVSVAET